MISKKAIKISKKLKGFVNKKTINKYLSKNNKIASKIKYKKSRINPNNILIFIILFCGSIFISHLYSLWKKHKNKIKDTDKQLNIIPRSGIY